MLRFVGATFLLLAAYVTFEAVRGLWHRETPGESRIEPVLAVASLLITPLVNSAKLSTTREIGRTALRAEATERRWRTAISPSRFVGLVANALAGCCWADPVTALHAVPWLVKEGRKALSGEECCNDGAVAAQSLRAPGPVTGVTRIRGGRLQSADGGIWLPRRWPRQHLPK